MAPAHCYCDHVGVEFSSYLEVTDFKVIEKNCLKVSKTLGRVIHIRGDRLSLRLTNYYNTIKCILNLIWMN